jgi:hypothetical protein
MLDQQPGRVRARLADQPAAGPSVPADYLAQPRRVVPVNRRHDRMPLRHLVPAPQ